MNLTCLKSGIWQAELRVPEDVRDVIGKTRFAKSMRTRNKREAVVKAAPILEQWQSEIDLAKTDPQAFVAKQILHNARCDFGGKSSDSGVSCGHLAWLYDLPPSKALAYERIEWGSDIPLPAYMNTFIKSHYTKSGTQSDVGTAVGKRFGRLKRNVLPDGEDRSKCFHSIRKFVVTTLEQGGVAEGVAADLVGHEKPNITYNVYSGGSSIEQLSHAVEVLEERQQGI